MAGNVLTELVDSPNERLDVEYKSHYDLREPKNKATLARHIAAMSNFGGGYIVFGFNDDLSPCTDVPGDFAVDHDLVGGITSKYLDPSLHCDVELVASAAGTTHYVITVPPHGSEPVCAKAGGPDNKGLIPGVYYTRKAGPKSEAITSAAEWKDIIRRCALNERSAILGAVTAALNDATSAKREAEPSAALDAWAAAAHTKYLALVESKVFSVPLKECHLQFSYMVELAEPESLAEASLLSTARTISHEVGDRIKSGWPLFFVSGEGGFRPNWVYDATAKPEDFLEASYLSNDHTIGYDLWRLAPAGFATVLREFWEDTPDARRGGARTAFDPKLMARTLGELVTHAEAYAGQFANPVRVHFRCEWWGLKGRSLHSPNSLHFHGQQAETETLRTEGAWAVGRLANEKPAIIAALGGRVLRAFNWTNFTATWVQGQMSGWNRFG